MGFGTGAEKLPAAVADYADKVHLGAVCLAMYACFSVIMIKKKSNLSVGY